MSSINTKFQLDPYLPPEYQGKKTFFWSNNQSTPLASLTLQHKHSLQTLLNQYSWQEVLQNKSLVHLFLDRVNSFVEPSNPINKLIPQYEFGSSTWSSMEMSRYLSTILNDDRLDSQTKKLITQWIKDEKEYLPIAIILDGWRADNRHIRNFVKNPTSTNQVKNLKVSTKEIDTLAHELVEHLKSLPVGGTFKVLGGDLYHEIRLTIRKNEDGSFHVLYLDPAGIIESKVAVEIDNVAENNLLNPNFWKKWIEIKLTEENMGALNALIDGLGPKNFCEEITQKSKQNSATCPTHAIKAEFKQFFISHFSDKSRGLEQYRLILSLIADVAKTTEKNIDPEIFSVFERRENLRHTFLDHLSLAQNKDSYEKVKEAFFQSLCSLSENPEEEKKALEKLIEPHTPAIKLHLLYREFEKRTKLLSEANFQKLLVQYPALAQPEIHAGLKRQYRREDMRMQIQKGIEYHQNFLKAESASFISKFFNGNKLIKEDKLTPSKLDVLLTKYYNLESPKEFIAQISHLYAQGIATKYNLLNYIELLTSSGSTAAAHSLAELLKNEPLEPHEKLICMTDLQPEQLTQLWEEGKKNHFSYKYFELLADRLEKLERTEEILSLLESEPLDAHFYELFSRLSNLSPEVALNKFKHYLATFPYEAIIELFHSLKKSEQIRQELYLLMAREKPEIFLQAVQSFDWDPPMTAAEGAEILKACQESEHIRLNSFLYFSFFIYMLRELPPNDSKSFESLQSMAKHMKRWQLSPTEQLFCTALTEPAKLSSQISSLEAFPVKKLKKWLVNPLHPQKLTTEELFELLKKLGERRRQKFIKNIKDLVQLETNFPGIIKLFYAHSLLSTQDLFTMAKDSFCSQTQKEENIPERRKTARIILKTLLTKDELTKEQKNSCLAILNPQDLVAGKIDLDEIKESEHIESLLISFIEGEHYEEMLFVFKELIQKNRKAPYWILYELNQKSISLKKEYVARVAALQTLPLPQFIDSYYLDYVGKFFEEVQAKKKK